MARSSPLQAPVQYVKGVGPARASQLARLGIQTVEDLLQMPGIGPKRWERMRHAIRVTAEEP